MGNFRFFENTLYVHIVDGYTGALNCKYWGGGADCHFKNKSKITKCLNNHTYDIHYMRTLSIFNLLTIIPIFLEMLKLIIIDDN